MITLIALLQFIAAQGITLQDFVLESHEYYYSATPCNEYKDKDALILVCVEERKVVIVTKELFK